MDTSQLQYPVIIFDRDQISSTFEIRTNEVALLSTTPLTLKEQTYLSSIIVDLSGRCYDILSVKRPRKGNLTDVFDSLANRPIKIEILLNEVYTVMPLAEFSSRIEHSFQIVSFANVWETSGIDFNRLDTVIKNAKTVSEIIIYLSKDFP